MTSSIRSRARALRRPSRPPRRNRRRLRQPNRSDSSVELKHGKRGRREAAPFSLRTVCFACGRSLSRRRRHGFRLSNFVVGIHSKEHVVRQIVLMVIAVAVEFHVHLSAPGKPQRGIAGREIHGAIVDEQVIPRKAEYLVRLQQVGFDAKDIEAGGRDPDAALYRNLIELSVTPPIPDSSPGIFLFLKPYLPGSSSANAGQAFALIDKLSPSGRLQNRNAKIVKAGRSKRRGEAGVFPRGIPVFVEEKGIAGVAIDENDVGKIP